MKLPCSENRAVEHFNHQVTAAQFSDFIKQYTVKPLIVNTPD